MHLLFIYIKYIYLKEQIYTLHKKVIDWLMYGKFRGKLDSVKS